MVQAWVGARCHVDEEIVIGGVLFVLPSSIISSQDCKVYFRVVVSQARVVM